MSEREMASARDERRKQSVLTADQIDEIESRVRRQFEEYMKHESRQMDARFKELGTMLTSAFPDGDPSEHRRYHEEVMQYMRERRELWKSIREKTLAALFWCILVGLGTAVWQAIRTKLGAP